MTPKVKAPGADRFGRSLSRSVDEDDEDDASGAAVPVDEDDASGATGSDDEGDDSNDPVALAKRARAGDLEDVQLFMAKRRREGKTSRTPEQRSWDLQKALERGETVRSTRFFERPDPWQAGHVRIRFVRVGQGDCVLLKTPQGQVIMVDCGAMDGGGIPSEQQRRWVQDSIFVEPFFPAGAVHTIAVLIVTHADRDHYNLLRKILARQVRVERVYHSTALTRTGDPGRWITQVCPARNVKQVFHNLDLAGVHPHLRPFGQIALHGRDGSTQEFRTATTPAAPPASSSSTSSSTSSTFTEFLDDRGAIRILDEPNFRLSVLAANVLEDYRGDEDKDDPKNRGSIVTLAEFDTGGRPRSLLMPGDATRSTEEYLIARSPYAAQNVERLGRVTLAQIAHHGSSKTSSDPDYVKLFTNLEQAVCSSGNPGAAGHYLPQWVVLHRWWKQLAGSSVSGMPGMPAKHYARVWRLMTGAEVQARNRFTAGETDTVTFVAGGTTVGVDDSDTADPVPDGAVARGAVVTGSLTVDDDKDDVSEESTSEVWYELTSTGRKFVRKHLHGRALYVTGSHGNVDVAWAPEPAAGTGS